MKANELRLGNQILLDGKIEYVGGKMLNKLEDAEFVGFDTSAIQPIPLTEEWFLKFGFEKTFFEESKDFKIPYFEKECLIINGCFMDFELNNGDKLTIKSVHQLQNLYFALTNEELTINQSKP